MLNIQKLEQFHVKSNEDFIILKTETSKNIVYFSEKGIKVEVNKHDKKKHKLNYMFSYYDLEKWADNYDAYLPKFETLLTLFNSSF